MLERLFSGKSEVTTIQSYDSAAEIERTLNRTLPVIGVDEREYLHDATSEVAMRVKGPNGILGPTLFGIDIYVRDNGNTREIDIVPIGSSIAEFFRTSLCREYRTYVDFRTSRKKAEKLKQYLM